MTTPDRPCDHSNHPKMNSVGAKISYCPEEGLTKPWHGTVWMNILPYNSPLIDQLCEKLVDEFTAGNVTAATVLAFNEPEAVWFSTLTSAASAICKLHDGTGAMFRRGGKGRWSTPPGQAMVYLGDKQAKFHREFRKLGEVTELR